MFGVDAGIIFVSSYKELVFSRVLLVSSYKVLVFSRILRVSRIPGSNSGKHNSLVARGGHPHRGSAETLHSRSPSLEL